MNYNKEYIEKILDAVFPIPKHFGVISGGDFSEPAEFFEIRHAVRQVDPFIKVFYGMSKFVIVPPEGEIVIKIPFNGLYTEDSNGELEWCYFYGACCDDFSDYCLAEYEKYNELKTQELDCFVVETALYDTRNGVRVFIQEKITPDKELCFGKKPSKLSSSMAKSLIKQHDVEKLVEDDSWVAYAIDCYGYEKVKEFIEYCENVDTDIIEDSHCGNYGYRKDDTIAFLDFSNFYE